MTDEKRKPIHEIKIGRMRTSIWKDEGEFGPILKATSPVLVYRLPEDKRKNKKDNGWRERVFFNREEALLASQVLSRAFDYIANYSGEEQEEGLD
jgi:hypothetical protein